MTEREVLAASLTGLVVAGVGAQWLAWRVRIPSILLLLLLGLAAGPGAMWATGQRLLDPDALFGDLLLPLTSMAVGLILFEGGMTLRMREVREVGGTLWRLVTLGALVTWLLGAGAAYALGLLDGRLSLLAGAILVVTGPTVIGPLLRHIRPIGSSATLLKWEGIVIDPIGATLALLVFEAVLAESLFEGARHALSGFARTVVIGVGFGLLAGAAVVQPFRRHWIPDYLEVPVVLMTVLGAFTSANLLQEEAGLLAVTIMGVVVGAGLGERARKILHFKESLQVLLIAVLFLVLAARLDPVALQAAFGWRAMVLLAFLVLVVRPLSVAIAARGSGLALNERALVAWLAPRGIVAAAVASVFALRLEEIGREGATSLAPLVFVMILGTVSLYALTAPLVARRLGLAEANPQGLLILSAGRLSREVAELIGAQGIAVRVVDGNRELVAQARLAGIDAVHANALSAYALEDLELGGLGSFLAMTPNDEVNTLAADRFAEVFGHAAVYQLAQRAGDHHRHGSAQQGGRVLFDPGATYGRLEERLRAGEQLKANRLTEEFDFSDWRELYGAGALPMFLLTARKELKPCDPAVPWAPGVGDTLISLVKPKGSGEVPA